MTRISLDTNVIIYNHGIYGDAKQLIADSLLVIVASYLEAECDIFYSEDLHHGLIVEDKLTILNPFI